MLREKDERESKMRASDERIERAEVACRDLELKLRKSEQNVELARAERENIERQSERDILAAKTESDTGFRSNRPETGAV